MDPESAKALLGGSGVTNTTTTPSPPPDDLSRIAPVTAEALSGIFRQQEQEFLKRNTQPGVELDSESGLSGWERFALSFRREKDNQIANLQKKYGPDNVRLADDGDSLIVRALDPETQKPRDIIVDERNMSAKDFIDMAGAVPEVAAGILAMRGGRSIPKIGGAKGLAGMIRDIFASSAGAEGAGAVKDVSANLLDRGQANLGDVAADRAGMFVGDVAVGAALLPVGKLFSFIENPLAGSRGPIQINAQAARDELARKTGVNIPLTVGESTGSPIFSRTEVFMEKQPGGSAPFVEFREGQEGALRKLQSIIMGRAPVSEEDLGERLMTQLKGEVAPLEAGVESARSGVRAAGEAKILTTLASKTSPVRQLYTETVGNDIRKAVTSARDTVKSEADALFDKVRSLPGGEGAVFEAEGLKSSFQKILDNLPAPESITEVPTGLLDEFGSPILRTTKGKEVMREFVPPNVLARLKSVAGLKDAKFSLSDLQQMRREVYDDIAKGEGVPGLGTHYLAEIGKALTGAIDEGVSALPTSELKDALIAANKHYKEKVIPFNRIGLTEMFRSADEPGHQTGSQIFQKLFSGDRADYNYQVLKETLGEKNPAFVNTKRAIVDRILESSKTVGEDTIDAESFIKNLTNFRKEHRAISDEIFGGDYGSLARQGKTMMAAEPGAKVSESEIAKLIAAGDLTAIKLHTLVAKQSALDKAYKNEILKSVSSGNVSGIKPNELVEKVLSSPSSTPKEVTEIVASISKDPELLADVRAKMVENIFRGASRKATAADIDRMLSGDPTRIVSGTGVFRELEDPNVKEKVLSILGKDTFDNLVNYMRVEAARELKEDSFKSAGGIAAGAQIANLTKRGPLKYLTQSAKNWVVAKTLTNESLRNWLGRIPSNDPASVAVLMASVPFIQAVQREFGPEGGEAIINSIKASIDRWTGEKAEGYGKQQEQNRRADFEKFLNQPDSPSLTPTRAR